MRGFGYDTWPGRTGRSKGELPEAAALSTIKQLLVGIHSSCYLRRKKKGNKRFKKRFIRIERRKSICETVRIEEGRLCQPHSRVQSRQTSKLYPDIHYIQHIRH